MVTRTTPILGVALDGAGTHPVARHTATAGLLDARLRDHLGLARPTVTAPRNLADG